MNDSNKQLFLSILEKFDFVQDIAQILEFIGELRELVDAFFQALGGNFGPLQEWVDDFIADPPPGFEWLSDLSGFTSLTSVFATVTELVEKITGSIGSLDDLADFFENAFGDIWDVIGNIVNQILSALGVTGSGSILDRILDLADELGDLLGTAEDALAGATNAGDRIQDVIDTLTGVVGGGLGDLSDWVDGLIAGAVANFEELKDAFEGNYSGSDSFLATIQTIVNTLRGGLTGLIDFSRIPQLSLAQLTNQPGPNLLTGFGDFADAATMDSGGNWTWDASVGGGSARCDLNGSRKVLTSELVAVSEGQQLTISGLARKQSAVGSGNVAQLVVVPFVGDTAQAEVVIGGIGSGTNTTGTTVTGSWTVPVNVNGVRVRITGEAAGTSGQVWWDDVTLRKTATSLPQQWVNGLLDKFDEFTDDITAATAWITDLIEKLTGQARATIEDAIDDVADFASQLGTILSGGSVGSPLPNLSGALNIGSLQTTLNQFEDIFNGVVVTPINSIVTAVKDWWDQWFGGGSSNAIPVSQKGAANGVAPLNGSSKLATSFLQTNVAGGVPLLDGSGKVSTSLLVTDSASNVPTLDGSGKLRSAQLPSMNYIPTGDRGAASGVAPLNSEAVVPLANLPSEVGGSGGTGVGLPYVILYKDSQSIPHNTDPGLFRSTYTRLSAWKQKGTAAVTFEDGTNARWKFGLAGVWAIRFTVAFQSSTTGFRRAVMYRQITFDGSLGEATVAEIGCMANSRYDNLNQGSVILESSPTERTDYTETVYIGEDAFLMQGDMDDYWSLEVVQSSGAALNAIGSAYGEGGSTTRIICTYLGAA